MKPVIYLSHAIRRMRMRGVSEEQVERVLRRPAKKRTARREGALRFEGVISKRRRLAVIAEESKNSVLVVSVFWV